MHFRVYFRVQKKVTESPPSLLPESFKEDFPECIEDLEKKPQYPYLRYVVWLT